MSIRRRDRYNAPRRHVVRTTQSLICGVLKSVVRKTGKYTIAFKFQTYNENTIWVLTVVITGIQTRRLLRLQTRTLVGFCWALPVGPGSTRMKSLHTTWVVGHSWSSLSGQISSCCSVISQACPHALYVSMYKYGMTSLLSLYRFNKTHCRWSLISVFCFKNKSRLLLMFSPVLLFSKLNKTFSGYLESWNIYRSTGNYWISPILNHQNLHFISQLVHKIRTKITRDARY